MPNIKWITVLLILNIYATSALAQCVIGDSWYLPATNQAVSQQKVFSTLPSKGIVLLGEHHTNIMHHQWQLTVLKSLFKKQKNLVIGLEMQPRDHQPVLDQWVNNELEVEDFIKHSQWLEYWGSNFADYLPILTFARDNNIPLIALNISQQLLQGIAEVGWEQIPQAHREGVGDPAKPSKNYIKKIAASFTQHSTANQTIDKEAFLRFYQKQLLWDRAMAEKLYETINQSKEILAVGLMGSWHVIDKEGVPFQLQELGQQNVNTLVPWDPNLSCDSVSPTFADAIYGMSKQ